MRLWRRSSGSSDPFLAELGPAEVIGAAPVAIVAMDPSGAIRYRNQASLRVLQDAAVAYGDKAIEATRAGMRGVVRDARTFPHVQIIEGHGDGGRVIHLEMILQALPGGYVCSYRDVTREQTQISLLARTAEELRTLSTSFEQLSTRLRGDTGQVSEQSGAAAAGAEQMSASIRDISSSTSSAAGLTADAVREAGAVTEQIAKLRESSDQINVVSKLINSIAEQTNLLALNATIEAARAGEAGKGFAVVAGEVKDLAGRTSEATGQIGAMIEAIQTDSEAVSAGIARIAAAIERIEAEQSTIAAAVEQQSATATDMSNRLHSVANAAHSSAEAAGELGRAAAEIMDRSRRLQEIV